MPVLLRHVLDDVTMQIALFFGLSKNCSSSLIRHAVFQRLSSQSTSAGHHVRVLPNASPNGKGCATHQPRPSEHPCNQYQSSSFATSSTLVQRFPFVFHIPHHQHFFAFFTKACGQHCSTCCLPCVSYVLQPNRVRQFLHVALENVRRHGRSGSVRCLQIEPVVNAFTKRESQTTHG